MIQHKGPESGKPIPGTKKDMRTQRRVIFWLALLAGCLAGRAPAWLFAAEPAGFLLRLEAKVLLDGKVAEEGRVFTDAARSRFFVCVPGDYVYQVLRRERKVVALRRSSVMVKQERCRPLEGAPEQPIEGHLFAETQTGFSFNDLAGRKVAVALPPGTLR